MENNPTKIDKPEILKISNKYFEEVIDHIGRSLTGKAMKRFDIIPHRETLKNNIKELIYEEMRNLHAILVSYTYGYEFKVYEVQRKKE